MKSKLIAAVGAVILSLGIAALPISSANAAVKISAVLPAAGVADGATAPIPVTVSGINFATFSVSLKAANGNLAIDDVNSVATAMGSGGLSGTPSVTFHAAKADAIDLLKNHLSFTSTQTGGVNVRPDFTITIQEYVAGVYINPVTGHTYQNSAEYDADHQVLSWSDAQAYAATLTVRGHNGYLANLTTQAENDFIAESTDASNVWMGATDDPTWVQNHSSYSGYANAQTEGYMIWGAGSEEGTNFSHGLGTPEAVGSSFESWATNEPNNWHGIEGCGVTNWNDYGLWNDLDCSRTENFLVEFDTTLADYSSSTFSFDAANATLPVTGGNWSDMAALSAFGGSLLAYGVFLMRRRENAKN